MQPAPERRFYITLEADGRLGTDFSKEEIFRRVIDTQQKDQCWYAVGLPFTFAILLHQATGEERYAKLARWFFDFQSRCVNPWDGGSSGKAAWGCSILYRETGDPSCLDIAAQVASNIMSCQAADGWYNWGAPLADDGKQDRKLTVDDINATSEFIVWLGLIGANLLAHDGG